MMEGVGRRWDVLEGPVEDLMGALRACGRPELAALLFEWMPEPGPDTGDHLHELTARLGRLAVDVRVPPALQARAEQLRSIASDLPAVLGRAGTVWVRWGEGGEDCRSMSGHYDASWQGPDDDPVVYEERCLEPDLDEVLAWARRRSGRVIVRPAWDPNDSYWAGELPPEDDLPPLPAAP